MKPRTPIQILRCLDLGGYSARMVGGRIETRGPRPLAEPIVRDIKANRDALAALLEEWWGGEWPGPPQADDTPDSEVVG